MKIALINPPSPFLINERVFPNIGLVRVATALDKEHDVMLFDMAGRDDYLDIIKNIAFDFDYYGFSSTTPQFPMVYKMMKKLKKKNNFVSTIVGGPHVNAVGSLKRKGIDDVNIRSLEQFDTIFEGEGENTENIFKKGWQNGGIIKKLDDLPIPNRKFIDILSYKYKLNGVLTTNIQTQRGCPGKCIFCCGRDIPMYNRVRQHSPERVLQEMDELNKQFGYTSFMFYDDEVNLGSNRLEKLCKKLGERDYQHRGFIRSDFIVRKPESAKWMKDAGFVKLCTGVESGSDKILKIIKKGTTYDMNMKARQIIGDAGIHYESFFILGHPSETKEDVGMTLKWLKETKPDDYDINVLTPYPGSKIYNDAKPSTKYEGYNWEYEGLYFNKPDYSKEIVFYKGVGGRSAVNSRTDDMTEEYLHNKREEIEKLK